MATQITSLATTARSYLELTYTQSKNTLLMTSGRILSLTGDTKEFALGAFTVARRQAYATIGAGDVIFATVTKRRQELPSEAKQSARKVIETTKDRVNRANAIAAKTQDKVVSAAGELKDRGNDAVEAARKISVSSAKGELEGGVGQVKDGFNKLVDRGDQVVTDLRHDPVLVRFIGDVDKRVEKAADEVTSAAQKLRGRAAAQARRERSATTTTPVRATPASKVPSHRTTVRNTPAGEAPISTTPAYRAAAQETAVREAAGRKAAETRKQAAEERSAVARRAAATRKRNAAQRAASPAPAKKATAKKATPAASKRTPAKKVTSSN
jgi:hypothetical protein